MKKLIERVVTSGVLVIAASGMFATAAATGAMAYNHNETVLRG